MSDRRSERVEFLSGAAGGTGEVDNISATGVAVRTGTPLETGTVVQIGINGIVVSARVVYCRPVPGGFRAGLEFCRLTGPQQEKLQNLVESFSRGVPLDCTISSSDAGI